MSFSPIALISDIHGNFDALLAVISEIKSLGINLVFNLGDTVGKGDEPVKCLKFAVENKGWFISLFGNHDAIVSGACENYFTDKDSIASIDWTRKKILSESPKLMDELASFPKSISGKFDCPGGSKRSYFFTHGFPPEDYKTYCRTGDDHYRAIIAAADCEGKKPDIVAVGHTHQPFFDYLLEGMIVNPGSVGLPKNGRASFMVVDPQRMRGKVLQARYALPGI